MARPSRYAVTAGFAVAAVFLAAGAAETGSDVRETLVGAPVTVDLGGGTTRVTRTDEAFTFMAENAPQSRQRAFFFGNRVFNTKWAEYPASVQAFDGLGPLFNRNSCSGCHTRDGRGAPPENVGDPIESMLVRLSGPDGKPDPRYGDQLNDRANLGVPPEGRAVITYEAVNGAYGDGTPYTLQKPTLHFEDLAYGPLDGDLTSPRVAQAMIGLGLLEAVPESTLAALADPDDADGDGISGRINRFEFNGHPAVGRFGWKANMPTLADQAAGAALGDIGLTTTRNPAQNCTDAETACRAALAESDPELSDSFFDRLVTYTQTLAVPQARPASDAGFQSGLALFRQMGCAACHMPTLQTDAHAALPELANQTFHPFTDLLLHDMGAGLADGRPDRDATGSEWRTAPLWGMGLIPKVNGHDRLLHDGRARGPAEAILWHGGEAERAKENFRAASAADRAALIAFLNAL